MFNSRKQIFRESKQGEEEWQWHGDVGHHDKQMEPRRYIAKICNL